MVSSENFLFYYLNFLISSDLLFVLTSPLVGYDNTYYPNKEVGPFSDTGGKDLDLIKQVLNT